MPDSKRLVWDQTGEKTYETGVDRGVLYKQAADGTYPKGVAWNGLTNVTESPSGAEPTSLYADNIKYLTLMSAEELGGSIEAYTYPPEFAECDGSQEIAPGIYAGQQNRKAFGFSYRSLIGNDTEGTDYGYKLHLVYGALASPSEKAHSTVNDSPEAGNLSWEYTTTPVPITEEIEGKTIKPMASLEINSTAVDPAALKKIEDALYGTETTDPYLPLPDEILKMLKN